MAGLHRMATAFDHAAGVYENARPGYPAEAVAWVVEKLALGPGRRVADIAAGTGKLTRDLLPTGAHVVAVEPVDAMRRALATSTSARRGAGRSAVSVVAAVAQALPLGDGVLDAVTVAQAFHWFATDRAVSELHRVIRPGGRLALMWNHRDGSDPLQAALTELMEPRRRDTPSYDTGAWRHVLEPGDRFVADEETHVAWRQAVDVEGVVDRVASVSFIAALPGAERARLLDRVRATATAAPPPLSLAYTADVFLFTRTQ